MDDCLFCRIARGDIPSKKVYEDDNVYAFHDIDPKAPVHILVIPKTHVQDITCIDADNAHIIAEMTAAVNAIVRETGLYETGFRVIMNTGHDGGQSVPHLHMHILGGKELPWP